MQSSPDRDRPSSPTSVHDSRPRLAPLSRRTVLRALIPALALPALASCGGGSDGGPVAGVDENGSGGEGGSGGAGSGGAGSGTPGRLSTGGDAGGDGAVDIRATRLDVGLDEPWSLNFLPDGSFLVTERAGRLRRFSPDGSSSVTISGLPAVATMDQAGLLDLLPAANFAADPWLYFTYAQPRPGDRAGTAVARARLNGAMLTDLQVLFAQQPDVAGGQHFGTRMAFGSDGNLFVTLGDRRQSGEAQSLQTTLGKTIRIRPDGTIPTDNPAFSVAAPVGSRPEDLGSAHPDFASGTALGAIWTYGHRNPQGIAVNPADGSVWISEHGERGGDELNRLRRGRNYGWPRISYSQDYATGLPFGEATTAPDVEGPRFYWPPVGSIAPAGMLFVTGNTLPGWQGSLVLAILAAKCLIRFRISGDTVVSETRYLGALDERIRDVAESPGGVLHFITDSGRLYRISAA